MREDLLGVLSGVVQHSGEPALILCASAAPREQLLAFVHLELRRRGLKTIDDATQPLLKRRRAEVDQ